MAISCRKEYLILFSDGAGIMNRIGSESGQEGPEEGTVVDDGQDAGSPHTPAGRSELSPNK